MIVSLTLPLNSTFREESGRMPFVLLVLLVFGVVAFLDMCRRRAGSGQADGNLPGRVIDFVWILSFYYLVLSVLYLVTFLVTNIEPFGTILSVGLLYTIEIGSVMVAAKAQEGCEDCLARFCGKGASVGFWFSNLIFVIMIAIGGRALMQLCTLPDWYKVLAAVAGVIIGVVAHRIDSKNYGNEPDGQPKSSAESPSKLAHDFVVQGLFMSLHLLTWVPYLVLSFVAMFQGAELGWQVWLMLALLAVMGVGSIISGRLGPIDRAKLHPADY